MRGVGVERAGLDCYAGHVILIVEDHADTCDALRRLLGKHGYDATCCGSGEEALQALKILTPNLVVLDYTMPGLSGLDVFHQMKRDERLRSVPVIFYSAVFDFDVARLALHMGATEWLVKGVHTPKHFVDAVERVFTQAD